MLVSARVDPALREGVAAGRRPRPEFHRLEADHGVRLLDWLQLRGAGEERSATRSIRHAAAAFSRLDGVEAVFSDGEHVGIPLGLLMAAARRQVPHLVIGHHLTSRFKPALLRLTHGPGITRFVLHSALQRDAAVTRLGIRADRLALLPYHADTDFWRPQGGPGDATLVVAAGREHRDYATLAAATGDLPVRVVVGLGSRHSPAAPCLLPANFPANHDTRFLDYAALRTAYDAAAVVVVPLQANDFQAGVTTLLEAMAMGKAVVVSATPGMQELVEDGVNGLLVPPGSVTALRERIQLLLDDPLRRAALGQSARETVVARFSLSAYAAGIAAQLSELASGLVRPRAA